jgi:hypothetical protein
MAKLRGSKESFLKHIKLWLQEGLSNPHLLTEYTKAAIKNIEDEIQKRGKTNIKTNRNKNL